MTRPAAALGSPPAQRRGALQLRQVVAAHPSTGRREASSKARFLAELDRLADPCDQYAGPVHVTASAVVAGAPGTVLHRHRLLGRWLQPGGHVERGEPPPAAAVREVLEETGLAARHPDGQPLLVHLDVHGSAKGHVHLDLRYLLVTDDTGLVPLPGESQEVAWFVWDEAVAIADESLMGALEAARRVVAGWETRGARP